MRKSSPKIFAKYSYEYLYCMVRLSTVVQFIKDAHLYLKIDRFILIISHHHDVITASCDNQRVPISTNQHDRAPSKESPQKTS